jgi:hypothetical protein
LDLPKNHYLRCLNKLVYSQHRNCSKKY